MQSDRPRPQPSRSARAGVRSLIVLITVAVAIAAAAAIFIGRRLNRPLHVSTDIIGYPTFHAFNPYVYEQTYYLAVLGFPLIMVAVLVTSIVIWRRLRLPLPTLRPTFPDEPDTIPLSAGREGSAVDMAGSVARVLAVGAVLGLALAVWRGDSDLTVAGDAAAVALIYAIAVAAVALLSSQWAPNRSRLIVRRNIARANVVGATLSLIGPVVAAQVTQVDVAGDGATRHYTWLPASLGIAIVVAGLLVSAWRLRHAGDDAGTVARLERRAVFLVAVPVGLFLLLASLPGVIVKFQAFEDGQGLTTLRLVQQGAFPWRDWATTHGVLEDAVQTLFSSTAVQDSNWGIHAGFTLLIVPACLIALYFLAYRVLGRTWPFLVLLGLMFFDGGYSLAYLRFAFWPLILILLGLVIDRRRPWLAAVLGAVIVAQAVISQETAYCLPGVGLALLGSDASRVDWRRKSARLRGFAMTFWAIAGGAVVTVALLIILVNQHALSDFIRFYTAEAPDHILTGAIPHLPLNGYFGKMALIPIAAMLATIALLATKVWLRRRLNTLDWMLVAAAVLAFLYYPKFLDRADLHVGEAFAAAAPMLVILAAALLKAADPVVRWRWRSPSSITAFRYTVAGLLIAAVVTQWPVSLGQVVSTAPSHFRMVAATEPTIPAIGYAMPQAIDPLLVSDLNTFLHAYMKSGDRIFDFTNEPGLLFYLLDFRPSTAYYTVTVAIRQVVQQDLVDQLRADRPLFVVFAQREVGLPGWDGVPNMVRHYDVSQYLLANYRPFIDVHGQVIYVDKRASLPDPLSLHLPLSTPLISTDLPFRGLSCEWGYSPNYLSVTPPAPPPGQQAITVNLTRDGPTSYLLTLPPGHRWDDYNWFEMNAASSFTASQLQLQDEPPPAGEQRAVTFWTMKGSPSTYRFPIGACSQWPGYGDAPLHLTMTSGQDIGSVRLLP
jgi:hypothetical protein